MGFRINSLYICVKDMERAVGFYEALLDRKVAEYDEIYSVFEINGFRLGLFANGKVNEKHVYGDNCLPSFETDSVEKLQGKVASMNCPVVFPLTRIKNNWVLEIADSEGNHIELTAPVKDF
ncbi:MAG: VOC family protein [Bacillota bacterium]|nr:VOC family protein [Bacillota bacterium]